MPEVIPFSELTQDNAVFKAAGVGTQSAASPPATEISFSEIQSSPDSIALDEISHVDDFYRRPGNELFQDDKFDPRAYFAQNPDVAKDPAQLQKLLDVYRARRERGITTGAVKEALKSAPATGVKFAKGAGKLASNVFEFSGLQPLFNKAASVVTGDIFDKQKREALDTESDNRATKALAEFQAGTELSATGIADLGRTGVRKFFGKSVRNLSDQELLAQLSEDVAFQTQLSEIQQGRGESLKNAGLDAETLAKQGIQLDPEAIENLSLVDPATVIATAGIFKVVGVGGRQLATAGTREAATKVASALNTMAKNVAGKTVEGAGKVVTGAARATGAAIGAVPEVAAEAVGAGIGLSKGGLGGAYVGAKAAQAAQRGAVRGATKIAEAGERLSNVGQQIAGTVPRSAGLEKIFQTVGSAPVKGAVTGAVVGTAAAVPLAALTDDDVAAGGILGGGLALGSAAGLGIVTKTAIGEFAAKRQFDPHGQSLPVVDSPAYGIDSALDTVHTAQLKLLSPNEQGAVTTFREAVRGLGGEMYVVDAPTFKAKITDEAVRRKGSALTPAEQAAIDAAANHLGVFDGTVPGATGERRVVFLNGDAKAVPHESGHLFHSLLSPTAQDGLRASVREFYTPEQLADFQARYERRLGAKISPDAAIDELVAENFSALFNNVPVTELTAPKPFLSRLGSVLAEGGEALGIDLTGGRATPDLQAPVSHRLRQLFENAAREVIEANQSATPTAPVPAPAPASPPAPARNIRTTTKQQQDFAAKRAADTGIPEARELAKADPAVAQRVNEVSASMESGNPVLEIEHLGIASEGSAASPEGRTARRGTQETGYAELERLRVENRANAPESVVNLHQKTFVPVRWTNQGGTPTLVAMSLDKVISNIHRIAREAANKGAADLIPYQTEKGRLTEAGWQKAVSDAQAYAENQSNGFRGDGQRLTRPTEDVGLSIPAENPDYRPTLLGEPESNFQNLIQGLATPETAREQKGAVPGNIKGQIVAEANKRILLEPGDIKPKNAAKQQFKSFPGRSLKEVNPLRNELVKRGVPVRELIEVTERIRAKDIASVKPRPDINFKAPVTDIIRGGFLPGGISAEQYASQIANATGEEFSAISKSWKGGLTGEAWRLGRGVQSQAEVATLKRFQEQQSVKSRALMAAKDYEAASPEVMKGQFFREAWEAATGEGSAGSSLPKIDPTYKPPFPIEAATEALTETPPGVPDASGALPGYEPPKPAAPAGSIGRGFQPPEAPRPDNTALFLPAEKVDSSVRYAGDREGLTPLRFLPDEAPGSGSTPASPSYPDADRVARERNGNVWVRQSPDVDNKNRVLLVQFTPELMYPNGPDPVSTPYYDKLYSGAREGYTRGTDFWELPQWVAVATENLGSKADFYAVRNMEEAKAFLSESDYGRVAFSVMDVSKAVTEELVPHIKGQVDLGGYTDRTGAVAKNPNAKIWNSMNEFIESMGIEYKKGFDYRHFRGTEIIPRLELSAGCRHRCTFCTIDRKVTNSPLEEINAQVDSFSDLNAKLVYLNDKTFGQSPNVAEMPRLYKEMKAANPEFDGFVIQTTAAQMKIFTDKFLQESGIRYVELGVETYNDGILKELRKPATEKLIDEAVEKLRRNKINFIPNIVIGFPGETAKSYARTMEFLDKNSDVVSHVNVYNLAVYEGTEISKKVATKTAADADENSFSKSFYEDPKIHEDFAKSIYDYGTKQLERKTPFPGGIKFLPRTESGRALENTGFVIKPFGSVGNRGVEVFDADKTLVGEISSAQRGKDLSEITFVKVNKDYRGEGIGEALYRELADQLKADGVKTVTGAVVAPEPLAIRRKVFGDFKEIKLNGEPASFEQAIESAARVVETAKAPVKEVAAIEPINEITPESKFLPRTEAGRKLVEDGYEFQASDDLSGPTINVFKNGDRIAGISYYTRNEDPSFPKEYAMVGAIDVDKDFQRRGIGEALYRELGSELKRRGVKRLNGRFLNQVSLDLRKKVFGEFESLGDDVRSFDETEARERLPTTPDLLDALGTDYYGDKVEGISRITSRSKFLPADEAGSSGVSEKDIATAKRAWKELGTDSPFFKKWFSGSKVVDEDGAPMLLVHGTTKEFTEFDPSIANPENDFGLGIYMSSSLSDVERNYATIGPDLESQIDQLADRIMDDSDSPIAYRTARAEARRQLVGPKRRKIQGFAKLENPVVLGGPNETRFGVEFSDETGDIIGGQFPRFLDAVKQGVEDYGHEADFLEELYPELVDAPALSEAVSRIKKQLGSAEVTDDSGNYVAGEIVRRAFETLGYDGIIDHTVRDKFPGMFEDAGKRPAVPGDVVHVIAFRPEQVKAVGGIPGTTKVFSAGSRDIRFLPKTKRNAEGQPLTKDGLVDYERLYKELTAQKKRSDSEKTDYSKYEIPAGATAGAKLTGWILPDQEFVPLDTAFHEHFLAQNSDSLNKSFGTKFGRESDVNERLAALNRGFIRLRGGEGGAGALRVELNQRFFKGKTRAALEDYLSGRSEEIDRAVLSLLNDAGQEVSSVSKNVVELEGSARASGLLDALDELQTGRRGGAFLPAEQTFRGFEGMTPEELAANRVRSKVSKVKANNPEALLPQYARDEDGRLSVKEDGKPRPVSVEYDLINTPLARTSAKGLRGAAREEAIADALAKELVSTHKQAVKNPDIEAGSKWYSTARVRLKKLLGDDAKLFAELLGATSARTPVETNFRFAVDAYNRFKAGEYNDILAKYREGKQTWELGDVADFTKSTKNDDPTRGQFLDWWVTTHKLSPTQSNGKKFGANSRAVLRVLDGGWATEVKGPKTPNFAGNLSGSTFEATIDVWAARLLHRLANKDNPKRWRILPENETGVTDSDFYLGQSAFRKAADKIGIKPDALQAIVWYGEKLHWEKNGWTRGAGAERSDFNTLLKETERTDEGTLKTKTPQTELVFLPKDVEALRDRIKADLKKAGAEDLADFILQAYHTSSDEVGQYVTGSASGLRGKKTHILINSKYLSDLEAVRGTILHELGHVVWELNPAEVHNQWKTALKKEDLSDYAASAHSPEEVFAESFYDWFDGRKSKSIRPDLLEEMFSLDPAIELADIKKK